MNAFAKLTAVALLTGSAALVATASFAQGGRGDGGPLMGMIFAELDADKDGKVTPEEMEAHRTARVAALDSDKDGFISAEELAVLHMQMAETWAKARAERMLAELDTDADGKLSAAELAARPAPRADRMLDRIDTDDDGAISEAEFAAAQARMEERGGRHGHGGDRGGHRWGGWWPWNAAAPADAPPPPVDQ